MVVLRGDDVIADGVPNQFRHGVTIELAHDIGAVRFRGFYVRELFGECSMPVRCIW